VESTVNQLINWRMCKKHQMGWSRAGAQYLLHVKTAIINGRLDNFFQSLSCERLAGFGARIPN
jgi:hypothetical protein